MMMQDGNYFVNGEAHPDEVGVNGESYGAAEQTFQPLRGMDALMDNLQSNAEVDFVDRQDGSGEEQAEQQEIFEIEQSQRSLQRQLK